MDNFRKYRPASGRAGSTDGFINSSRLRGARSAAPVGRAAPAGYQSRSRIGDFSGTDGFHPAHRTHPSTTPRPAHHSSRHSARDASARPHAGTSASKAGKHKRFARIRKLNPFNRDNWSKKKTIVSFAVMVLLVGGYFGSQAFLNARKIFRGGGGAAALQDGVDPAKLRGEGDGRVNILLLGRGGAGHEGADLTDTILVASIDPIQKEAALLSIPRDLYVRTSNGGYSKINSVFANAKDRSLATTSQSDGARDRKADDAGFKAVEDIIQSKIGIPVHYHVMIDFEGFKKAVDTVGGVDVNVGPDGVVREVMTINNRRYVLDVAQGSQHFDGMRALAYARSRHTSARGDFSRSERQRSLLVGLKNKIFSLGTFSNPLKVNQLMSDFGSHVQANMTTGEVMRLYDIGKGLDSAKIASVGLADPPNNYLTTDMVNGLSVVIPRAGVDNYKEVQTFVRNRLRDGFLAQENASVVVLNGTAILGLAGRTGEDLKSYGYNVTQIGDAPTKNFQKTVVVDMRNGSKKYTKSYLERRFGLSATNSLPDPSINPGNADFVIILGQNEQTRLSN